MKSGFLRRAGRFVAGAVLMLLTIGAVGMLFPGISGVGEVGAILTIFVGVWLIITPLIAAIWLILRWRSGRQLRTLVFACLAGFAALANGYVQTVQVGVARSNGVRLDPAQVLTASAQTVDGLTIETVNYSRFDGQDMPLDIYRPAALPGGKTAPVIVYVHGGGWGSQTLRQRPADMQWFAERGYLAISLEYPLSSATRNTWNVAEPQLACAMVWIAANAARLGGDPARLVLWGESAGGNLVLNLAYRANAGTLDSACEGTPPKVDVVMALYPVVDPALMYRPPDPLLGVFGRSMGDNYTGGSPQQYPERYAAIASATHIGPAAPPTLLIVPEADHLVEPAAAYDFAENAAAVGIVTQVIRVPYAEHAFDLRDGSVGNQLVRQTMLQFLATHGLNP